MAIGRKRFRLVVFLVFGISAGLFIIIDSQSGYLWRGNRGTAPDWSQVGQLVPANLTGKHPNRESIIGPRYECLKDDNNDDDDEEEDESGIENELSIYGKPVYAKNKTVFYLSMPKSGSRTFVWTLNILRKTHHFGEPVNLKYMLGNTLASQAREYLSTKLREADDGAVLHGHYRYLGMNGSAKKPVFLSMLRDPIDRFESHFYFMRHGDQDMNKEKLLKNINLQVNMALPNETLDDCVEKERAECTMSIFRNMYVTSFCGYELRCSSSPSYALKKAKKNVDKFLAIGIMEEYHLSMAVLEKLLPSTFGGAPKIYEDSKGQPIEKFKTSYKKLPSQETYSILKERMKYDYEFYDYVKRRLHKVARRLQIGQCSSIW